MFFRYIILRIKVAYFSKIVCYQRLFFDLSCQNMLCDPFYISYYNNVFFFNFFKELGVVGVLKYDILTIVFLRAFVTYGVWFARSNFSFRGACSSKIDKKYFSKKT